MIIEDGADPFVEVSDFGVGVVRIGLFELLFAEFEFAFLNGGHALASGHTAEAAEHGGDFGEGVHVVFNQGTGEGELEGELFEGAHGAAGEVGLAVSGEFEDLAGGFVVLWRVFKELGRSAAPDETLESGFVDGLVEFLGGALDRFAVAEGFNENAELMELAGAEVFEAVDVGFHRGIAECGFRIAEWINQRGDELKIAGCFSGCGL